MIRVRVPATSANIGPGFDAMGLALELYNEFEFERLDSGVEFTGFGQKYRNENNLVLRSVRRFHEAAGIKMKGIRIGIREGIPVSRGLGSSAACIVGGLLGANALEGQVLSKQDLIRLAVEIEGHPDNVVPAFEGGLTVSFSEAASVRYERIPFESDRLCLYALIPDFEVSTEKARRVLPKAYPLEDAVYNISRTAMLVARLVNGNFSDLWPVLEDRVHQPYRSRLIRGFDAIEGELKRIGFDGLFISGAGPTLMGVLAQPDDGKARALEAFLETLEDRWAMRPIAIDGQGARML